jgi:tetratricopeptide (TPR) repeat protein
MGRTALALYLAAVCAMAQQRPGTVNTETPEGQLLHQASNEEDAPKKAALLSDFAAKFPQHESVPWVWSQIQQVHLKAGQFDKALEAGEKLAAKDPNDLECAHNNLKSAEGKKDPDAVRKWAGLTSQLALKAAAVPKPSNEDDVEAWKARADFAKQLNTYTEYSLFAAAVQTQDPKKRVELAEALREQNPQSQYIAKMNPIEFNSYRQLNDNAKALATAERTLATDQSDEDMLVFAANNYLEGKKDPDKVIAYSMKAVEVLNTKPKPEGVADDVWNGRKNTLAGLAHFMAGSTYYGQKKLKEADAALRAGLPMVGGNDQLKAATLFYLGLAANDQGKLADALAFNQQCAAIKSAFQAKAAANAKVLRSQGVTTGAAPKKK